MSGRVFDAEVRGPRRQTDLENAHYARSHAGKTHAASLDTKHACVVDQLAHPAHIDEVELAEVDENVSDALLGTSQRSFDRSAIR